MSRRWLARHCATGSCCVRKQSSKVPPPMASWREFWPRFRCPASGLHQRRCSGCAPMTLTGRTGLLALICVLPIALSPWPATTFNILLVVLLDLVVIDVVLAASPRKLSFTRSPDSSARLGQPANSELLIHND